MKRVLFVYHVSSIGGGSYCLLNLLKVLDLRAISPTVLLPKYGPLCEEISKLGVNIEYLPSLTLYPYNKSLFRYSTVLQIRRMLKARDGFVKVVKQIKPDIVYFNTMMLFPFLKVSKKLGCKTILHVREHWPLNEHNIQLKYARHEVYQYADKLIAINNYSASIFPQKQSVIVYDWIDLSNRYQTMPFEKIFGGDAAKLKVFLFTGGLSKIKGTIEVVNTFKRCVKGEDYRLLMMGSGLDYKLKLKGITGVIERIFMMFGWKPYGYKTLEAIKDDPRIMCIQPTYNIVNIFRQSYCMLSYFTIPHANLAMAEAIVLGIPTIAANTEEALEYSDNGEGAVLYNFNNLNDFENKIKHVISHYEEVKQNIKQHSEAVKQLFSLSTNAAKFNDVLASL